MDDSLTYQDVDRILAWIDAAPGLAEFSLRLGDLDISLSRGAAGSAPAAPAPGPAVPMAPAPVPGTAAAPDAAAPFQPGGLAIKSPMVGTFYRAPEPGAPPFVEVGQQVESDTTVCIIEVMKLMNSIPAGAAGVVRQILVPDGGAVEYGQVLLVIEPGG